MIPPARVLLCAAAVMLFQPVAARAQIPYPPPYGYDMSASLRLQVEPKATEVFVDGYWAGTADDFDGFFQRLHLEPGDHDIELYLDGHRPFRQKIYLQPHATFRIRHDMAPLAPGETADPRPVPRERPDRTERPGRYEPPGRDDRSERTGFGTLALRVRPQDAEIAIDGAVWERPEGVQRFEIELPAGPHRLEIRKDGFAVYERTVRVRRGDTTAINVSLSKE